MVMVMDCLPYMEEAAGHRSGVPCSHVCKGCTQDRGAKPERVTIYPAVRCGRPRLVCQCGSRRPKTLPGPTPSISWCNGINRCWLTARMWEHRQAIRQGEVDCGQRLELLTLWLQSMFLPSQYWHVSGLGYGSGIPMWIPSIAQQLPKHVCRAF
jgi:hypothetical protein